MIGVSTLLPIQLSQLGCALEATGRYLFDVDVDSTGVIGVLLEE
jgi:hypothetical protein